LAKFNFHKLKDFGNLYKLTKYVIGFIASRAGEEDITNLKKVFEEIDTNKSGTLDIHEIKNSIDKMASEKQIDDEEKETIIKQIDTDKSAKIEYNEFLTACLEQKVYLREENLLSAFMMLDLDGSGKISKAEIKQALNKDIDNETLDRIIKDFYLFFIFIRIPHSSNEFPIINFPISIKIIFLNNFF
jgi:calcium-dependent protein kinase